MRSAIAITLISLVILFELPKLEPAFEYAIGTEHQYGAYYVTNEFGTIEYKIDTLRTYHTPSTFKYGL
jgi:hypothetical protein